MSDTPVTIGTRAPVRASIAAVCGIGLAASALAVTPAQAQYPGDNGLIAYFQVTPGDFQANPPIPRLDVVYTAKPDGSDRNRVTPRQGRALSPSWSPDGTKLVYIKPDEQVANDRHVYVRDLASGQETQITGFGSASGPTWNQDGTKITYAVRANPNDPQAIGWSYADGSAGGQRLSPVGQNAGNPAYSPDGQYIAYSVTKPGQNRCPGNYEADLWIMASDGSNSEQVTAKDCASYSPSWSPDGKRIAFASTMSVNGQILGRIYTMNVDDRQLTQLTDGPNWKNSPDWSPDGKYIVYASDDPQLDPDNYDIRVMAADGSDDRSTGLTGRGPSWQPTSNDPNDPNNPNNPNTPGAGETELTVKAMKAKKKLAVGVKKKLVKSATTNGEITKVKIVCKVDGKKYVNAKAKKPCGAKEKKKSNPDTARVVAKLKCDTKVKIKAVVKAQYQQAQPAKWKRTWKVKKNTGPNC
jgi:dipeptidyl aminopeptidase/acylaminoacyl peptidase